MLEVTNKRITMQDSKNIYIYAYIVLKCISTESIISVNMYVTNKEKHCLRSNKLPILDLTSTVLCWYIYTSRKNPISDLLESFSGTKVTTCRSLDALL